MTLAKTATPITSISALPSTTGMLLRISIARLSGDGPLSCGGISGPPVLHTQEAGLLGRQASAQLFDIGRGADAPPWILWSGQELIPCSPPSSRMGDPLLDVQDRLDLRLAPDLVFVLRPDRGNDISE